MDKIYIVIGQNIWEVISETENQFEIQTRTTTAFIEKELCFVRYGSTLLYYEGQVIRVQPSRIEIESEEEYQLFLDSIQEETDLWGQSWHQC